MAEKSKEQLEKELALANQKLEKANAENQSLRTGAIVGIEIKGSFNTTIKNQRTGKDEKVKVAFKPGRKYQWIDGSKVLTEAVLKIANGENASEEEMDETPGLINVTQEVAVDHLTRLARVQSADLA